MFPLNFLKTPKYFDFSKQLKECFRKTIGTFKRIIPYILGMLLLVSLSIVLIPSSFYLRIFSPGKEVLNLFLGTTLGSIAIGSPIVGYIIGGELLKQGVNLMAVTAFILAWVSVGIVQLPMESALFGKKFAITRNIVSFVTAMIIAALTALTLSFVL